MVVKTVSKKMVSAEKVSLIDELVSVLSFLHEIKLIAMTVSHKIIIDLTTLLIDIIINLGAKVPIKKFFQFNNEKIDEYCNFAPRFI
jgi:hypothetical protein